MIVQFPNLASIELALAAGAVPASVAGKPLAASAALDGPIAVRPAAKLSAQALQAIARFGATPVETSDALEFTAASWPQLIPLRREASEATAPHSGAAVLFVLEDSAALGELIGEILRLGNDRQSYRLLRREDGGEFALLRVVDPPYYALLRAIERNEAGRRAAAYVERAAGVWVEFGYRHPLESSLRPAKGEWLLLRSERAWTSLPAGDLHDVYAGLDIKLPPARRKLKEMKLDRPIDVPLRLAKTTGQREAATLWVVRDGFDAVNEFVHHADDGLLARLSFAVGEAPDGSRTIILRARPTREAPPALEFGVGCYAFLKLPNLFLPCAARLHPPLRRETVAELLAPDKAEIVWLYPCAGGQFERESLPDDAFRPLGEWVEYVFDREAPALEAWRASCQFDFASFVVDEPRERTIRLEHEPVRQLAANMPLATIESEPQTIAKAKQARAGRKAPQAPLDRKKPAAPPLADSTAAPANRSPIEARLREVETAYRQLAAPHDSPERAALWREMGELNARLGRRHEAALAWSSALWGDVPLAFANQVKADWFASERQAANDATIEAIASRRDPTGAEAGIFAACTIAGEYRGDPAQAARFLDQHQPRLPARVAWLAWTALARLAHGDVLALARARDRLLSQLHQFGLRPTHDTPSFVRSLSGVDSERVRAVRHFLTGLQPAVERWLLAAPVAAARTGDYASLLFASALARVGDSPAAQALLQEVCGRELTREKPLARAAHHWLRDAFAGRIGQVRGSAAAADPPPTLAARLQTMKLGAERPAAYAIERLRESLALLEPGGREHAAFMSFTAPSPQASEKLNATQLDQLLVAANDAALPPAARYDALAKALERAPEIGESYAQQTLAAAESLLAEKGATIAQEARALGRSLAVAAHFGDGQRVAKLAGMLERRLAAFIAAYLDDPRRHADAASQEAAHEAIAAVEGLLTRGLAGMRRLGQAESILRIVRAIEVAAEAASGGSRAASSRAADSRGSGQDARDLANARLQSLRLHAAEAYFAHAEREPALAILASVRQVLVQGDITPLAKTNLLCRYALAWGHAPTDLAFDALYELFQTAAALPNGPSRRAIAPMEERHKRLRSEDDYFSLLDLRVIDAALRAVVGDETLLSPETRRWLDEDEFSIRRRLHLDVHNALS